VIYTSGVASFGPESFQKAWITEILGFQNLDSNITQDNRVMGLPNLTHPTDSDSTDQLVTLSV
jgi:hypothetical protein